MTNNGTMAQMNALEKKLLSGEIDEKTYDEEMDKLIYEHNRDVDRRNYGRTR